MTTRQPRVELRWASLGDLRGRRFRHGFAAMEYLQARFAHAHRQVGGINDGDPEPMYDWAGRAAYPFILRQLGRPMVAPRVLDASAAVTFLPVHVNFIERLPVVCLHGSASELQHFGEICRLMSFTAPPRIAARLGQPLPVDASFGAVVSIGGLDALDPAAWPMALGEMWRLLAPGGRLLLTSHVTLDGVSDGLAVRHLPVLMRAINDVLGGGFAHVPHPPRRCLTPRNPGYGLAPLRTDHRVIPRGWAGRRAGFRCPSIAGESRAMLLLATLEKPGAGDGHARPEPGYPTPSSRVVHWGSRAAVWAGSLAGSLADSITGWLP